jgi:hypothetical protein
MSELLSNHDLIFLCKKFGINLIEVVFKDGITVSDVGMVDGAYIINLDETESIGTHWVCAHKQNKTIIYFDSFGENVFEELKAIGVDFGYKIIESMFQLQHLKDDSCGFYCLAFLNWVKSNQQLNSRCLNLFNEMFRTDRTKSNRKILSKYLKTESMNLKPHIHI